MKTVRVSLTEAHINILLNLTSKELLRQITHKAIDPLTAETSMRIVKAKEKFMPQNKETGTGMYSPGGTAYINTVEEEKDEPNS